MSTVEQDVRTRGTARHTTSTAGTDHFGSGSAAPFNSEARRLPRQSAFESQLPGLLAEFAIIESGDYTACYAFAKRHPEIWDQDRTALLRDACAALIASKESHAKRCVQRAVMILECSDLSPNGVKNFFDGLINKKRAVLEDFLNDCSNATASLRAKCPRPESMPPTSGRTAQQNSNTTAPSGSTSFQSGHPRIASEQRSVDTFTESGPRMHQDTPDSTSHHTGFSRHTGEHSNLDRFPGIALRARHDALPRQDTSNAQSRMAGAGAVRRLGTSDVPTVFVDSEGRASDTLDDRYKVRASSATFFTFGRVFATTWHTTLGANQANFMQQWVVKDCFAEFVLTHIQRLIVVKEGHGFSWCVPIITYAGRGVTKPGLSKSDRLAHAIIHMAGTDVRPTAAERGMMEKNPIAVHAAAADQKLDVMSRINFSKVYTIEHNVRAMDVGRVSRDSMDDFREYWNEHR